MKTLKLIYKILKKKANSQNKELKKFQDQLQVETRRLNAFESQNTLLEKRY